MKFWHTVGLYSKEIQNALVTVLLCVAAGLTDGYLDATEVWTAVGVAIGASLAMSFIANATSGWWKYAKAYLGAASAGVSTLIPLWPGGLTPYEITAIVIAMVSLGLGTAAVSNARKSESPAQRAA